MEGFLAKGQLVAEECEGGKSKMREDTKKINFTFNPEHFKLLDQVSRKTGKDKRTIIGEAVELALSKNLSPTKFRWNHKSHRNLDANVNADLARKAKELHEGK